LNKIQLKIQALLATVSTMIRNNPHRFRLPTLFAIIISCSLYYTEGSHNCVAFGHICKTVRHNPLRRWPGGRNKICILKDMQDKNEEITSSYENSDSSSKGIVSSLTGIVNLFMGEADDASSDDTVFDGVPPTSPKDLLNKIRDDYVVNNYLWTGDIFLPAFEKGCRFTDPTLSFVGTDKFVSNVKNLRPIVDFLTTDEEENTEGGCRSELLDISVNEEEGYVQTRWNMIGDLNKLPWNPKIDVIGRTKFWYRSGNNSAQSTGAQDALRVYLYDEEWEIPASRALLQLVTPAGTIKNSVD